jgi:hypothetical protein
MGRVFNVTGVCIPEKHYMVDIDQKLKKITCDLIEQGKYFTINKARQFGKSTTLYMLERALSKDYLVISLSFEAADDLFESRYLLAEGLVRRIGKILKRLDVNKEIIAEWNNPISKETPFDDFDNKISSLCTSSDKKVVLMIDEVDKSSDNQIFLSFLGLLRTKYLDQQKGIDTTFASVILAGVYDIKNLKLKLHPESEPKYNSPWNIAVDFDVDMSFSTSEIISMLDEYEREHNTGMDKLAIANEIYKYTTGYPYLVSLICKYLDEKMQDKIGADNIWTPYGVNMAVKEILKNNNTLFDDMIKNLENNPEFKELVKDILLSGRQISYVASNPSISLGSMFGIIDKKDGICCISNTIFETYIYNHLIIEQELNNTVFSEARNQFITDNGQLDMNLIMQKFKQLMATEYRESDEKFIEKQGRLLFLCFLKPIINGTGHYVVEPQTRDDKRMDIVVFYGNKEYIIELKIWRGNKKHEDGVSQIADYLDIQHQREGWLLIFSFNKGKYEDEDIVYDNKLIHCTSV